jgi:hypothetical protein
VKLTGIRVQSTVDATLVWQLARARAVDHLSRLAPALDGVRGKTLSL